MYRRYTLDEIKRKIIDVLQSAGGTGLSGVELADKIGINRMTVTKYLDVMHAMGLLKKKKIGNVNIWFTQTGVADIDFPINYIQVQQKLISAILDGDEDHGRRILLSVMNSSVDQVSVLTDVIVPTVNTINEIYSRGKMNKTERIFLVNLMMELIDLIKFNVRPSEQKANGQVVCVAGSEDRTHIAKSAAVALLARGWDSSYIGDVGKQIDPFFDIDFQRYLLRLWGNKHGLLLVCIFSSGEGSLRFLSSTAKQMKGKLKGELLVAAVTTQELHPVAQESSDHVAKDLLGLVEWAEREFNYRRES
ncbi:MAG TPA: winged helix-turn-helix transcriptional regulator [Nitrososphaera sp.]|jgi:methanogenic corrinoid protein MtbC1|nr:winged helix-turn-helix transcriptional regulator [Nitrososphaera sp.]